MVGLCSFSRPHLNAFSVVGARVWRLWCLVGWGVLSPGSSETSGPPCQLLLSSHGTDKPGQRCWLADGLCCGPGPVRDGQAAQSCDPCCRAPMQWEKNSRHACKDLEQSRGWAPPAGLLSGISEGQLAAAWQGRRVRHSFPNCKRVGPSSAAMERVNPILWPRQAGLPQCDFRKALHGISENGAEDRLCQVLRTSCGEILHTQGEGKAQETRSCHKLLLAQCSRCGQ